MYNLFYASKITKKNIFFVLLLLISKSYATDNLNNINYNLTKNELITESVASAVGVNLVNTSFWFGTCLLIKKIISIINNRSRAGYECIGKDEDIDTKAILINSVLINLAEVSLLGNPYAIFPNNYIFLAIRILGFIGLVKFSNTKSKTSNEIFDRVISLILLENIVMTIPNSLFVHYNNKYPIDHKLAINATGVVVSDISSLLISTYIYDFIFSRTNSKVKSLACFFVSNLPIAFIGSTLSTAIINKNINDADYKDIWHYQMLGYCIFSTINSIMILSSFPKIKGYIPYLYSCLLSAYGFGSILFMLITLETNILKNNFFWQDADSDILGVLGFSTVALPLLIVPMLSAILTYNYGDKIIKKLRISNKKIPLAILGTVAPLCLTLTSATAMSFSYNLSFKQSLLYLNQILLKKFYSIVEYTMAVLKI